jgi:hypothetical protein
MYQPWEYFASVLPGRFDTFAPRLVYPTKLHRGGPGIPIVRGGRGGSVAVLWIRVERAGLSSIDPVVFPFQTAGVRGGGRVFQGSSDSSKRHGGVRRDVLLLISEREQGR